MTTREANIIAGLIVLSIACQVGPIIWDKTHPLAPAAEECVRQERIEPVEGAEGARMVLAKPGGPGQILVYDPECASGMKWRNP